MYLSQPDHEGKPQRACTPASHAAIKRSEALFKTLTDPAGYQDCRAVNYGVLELGTCRNCGSTLARKLNSEQLLAFSLIAGDA